MELVTVDFKTMVLVILPDKGKVTVISKLTGESVCLPLSTLEETVREALRSKGYTNYE